MTDTSTALPQTCTNDTCNRLALLRVGGLCPDCIGRLGLDRPVEHARWRAGLKELSRP